MGSLADWHSRYPLGCQRVVRGLSSLGSGDEREAEGEDGATDETVSVEQLEGNAEVVEVELVEPTAVWGSTPDVDVGAAEMPSGLDDTTAAVVGSGARPEINPAAVGVGEVIFLRRPVLLLRVV